MPLSTYKDQIISKAGSDIDTDKFLRAFKSFERALHNFTEKQKAFDISSCDEEEYCTYRDSLIQRFEYTIDPFWKYIKKYLDSVHALPDLKIPGDVIRTAQSIGLIDERESQSILQMIKSRNLTSHMYIEEVADQLARLMPEYNAILNDIITRLIKKSS